MGRFDCNLMYNEVCDRKQVARRSKISRLVDWKSMSLIFCHAWSGSLWLACVNAQCKASQQSTVLPAGCQGNKAPRKFEQNSC